MNDSRTWWTKVGSSLEKGSKALLLLFIGAYRTTATNFLGGSCRFQPSCSEYALEAAKLHPPLRAVRLIGKRVCSCRPGGAFGFDPVPRPHQEKSA